MSRWCSLSEEEAAARSRLGIGSQATTMLGAMLGSGEEETVAVAGARLGVGTYVTLVAGARRGGRSWARHW